MIARRRTAARSRQGGYTLIEVIVAFALLALGLSLLLGTLSGAARQVRWAGDAGRAALYAQSLLEQVGVGEALQPGQSEGDVDGGRYHWSLTVTPWADATLLPSTQPQALQGPRVLELVMTMQWGNGDSRQRLQLRTLRAAPADTGGSSP
jgi:general secretion pathway protein I